MTPTNRELIFVAAIALGACSGDDPRDSALAENVAALVSDHGIPGAAGVVLIDGEVETAAAGQRRVGVAGAVLPKDRFHIGSNTKLMTAVMIARLVDRGVLAWGSRPGDVIPGVAASLHAGYAESTVLDLLHHRAGVPADDDFDEVPTLPGTLREQRRAAAQLVLAAPPAVARGTYRYSNAGYTIAAAMAEAATGEDWRTLMDREVFAPLGITATYGWPTDASAAAPWGHEATATGYVSVDSSVEPTEIHFLEPAGDVSMTLRELARFMAFVMDAAEGATSMLRAATAATLLAPVDGYACGVNVVRFDAGDILWHNGSNTYFYAVMYMLPAEGIAAAVAVNAAGDDVGLATQTAVEQVVEAALAARAR